MSPSIARHPRRVADPGAASLAALFHRCASVPSLAELYRARGAKFITLVNRVKASRPALRQALDSLIEEGWVMRNPGYGHPMRPEYILTNAGETLGPPCDRLMARLDELSLSEFAQRKWSMPVLYVMRQDPQRFSDLRSALGAITDRALTLSLKGLVAGDLVLREVGEAYPPSPVYRLHRLTRPLVRELTAMAEVLAV